MPPKHPKPPNHPIKHADRLALAITGLKTGKYTTIHEAATQNAVPETTLRARVKSAGFRFRRASTAKNTRRKEFRLTRTEENTLSNWIVQVHEGGNGISPGLIHNMANTLLAKRGGTHGFRVTAEWIKGYLEFHPEVAALVEEDDKYNQEELGMRPLNLDLLTDLGNPEKLLKHAEDNLHNMTSLAKKTNEFEKHMQQDLRKRMVTEPDHTRKVAAAVEGLRQVTGRIFWKGVDQWRQLREFALECDLDTSRFVKGYEELLSITRDTKRVQEEMRAEFGGEKVPVEEES